MSDAVTSTNSSDEEVHESPIQLHRRVVGTLKEQGYSLSGCQLVLTDFEILSNVLQEEDNRDRIELYLHLCRTFKITNGTLLEPAQKRYALVRQEGSSTVVVSSTKRLGDAQSARFERRLNRCSANTCCLH